MISSTETFPDTRIRLACCTRFQATCQHVDALDSAHPGRSTSIWPDSPARLSAGCGRPPSGWMTEKLVSSMQWKTQCTDYVRRCFFWVGSMILSMMCNVLSKFIFMWLMPVSAPIMPICEVIILENVLGLGQVLDEVTQLLQAALDGYVLENRILDPKLVMLSLEMNNLPHIMHSWAWDSWVFCKIVLSTKGRLWSRCIPAALLFRDGPKEVFGHSYRKLWVEPGFNDC